MPPNRLLLRLFISSGQSHAVLTEMTEQEINTIMTQDGEPWVKIRGVRDLDDERVSCNFRRSTINGYFVEKFTQALVRQQAPGVTPRLIQ